MAFDKTQLTNLLEEYKQALDLLDDYDHQNLAEVNGEPSSYKLDYAECKQVIENMRFGESSTLFGKEKDMSFFSSISAIYQTAMGEEVYQTLDEKAANLLYFCTKNHSFLDGNKRIAATMFIYFLLKNNALYKDGKKRISNQTLVALTILIAESKPEEKDTIIKLCCALLK